jgi:hypothetical protein
MQSYILDLTEETLKTLKTSFFCLEKVFVFQAAAVQINANQLPTQSRQQEDLMQQKGFQDYPYA